MLNKVLLIGRLGKDPDMHYTPQGIPSTSFSIATERTWHGDDHKDQKETEWHQIVAWGKLGEICNEYLAKGRLVYIEGRLHTRDTREWEEEGKGKQRRTEVIAEVVKFLEHKRGTLEIKEELPL